jgi:hypothetical protein
MCHMTNVIIACLILKARISTSQLRRCQLSNLGRNFFCTKNENTKLAKQFLDELLEPHYRARFSTLPYFLNNNYTLPVRILGSSLIYGDVFERINTGYNAIDQDIAAVEVFFQTPYALQLKRSPTMNWIDYFSNVGGIYGLVLGMGIISFVELFWLLFQNWV